MHTQTSASDQPKKLVRVKTLAAMLDMTRSGVAKLRLKDPNFPKPIRDGDSRQAAVYFVLAEIEEWLANKMASRSRGE